jgi:nucleotide-binding universal stress UspA family protein
MQPPWKVLAPIDLAVDPEGSVDHAINIATAMRAELTLLYVVDQRWYKRARRLAWPRNALGRTQTPCTIHRLVLPGDAVETITRYADFIKADLVAMTSGKYEQWTSFWNHSVTGNVLEITQRPVCVTDLRLVETNYRFRSRRILCVLNLDGTDDQLILQAESLAQRSGGELILLGVVPELDEGLLIEAIHGVDRPLSANVAVKRLRELGKGIFVPYKTSVMMGSPYKCISAAAREHTADIVMAARSSPGRMESYCLDMRSVLRRISCPLVSVTGSAVAERPIAPQTEEAPVLEYASGF